MSRRSDRGLQVFAGGSVGFHSHDEPCRETARAPRLSGFVQQVDSISSASFGLREKTMSRRIGLVVTCALIGLLWLAPVMDGDGSRCVADDPVEVTGACCIGWHCELGLTEEQCIGWGGSWEGPNTTECLRCWIDAPPPGHACCYPDGSCEDVSFEGMCLWRGGLYQEDTTCADVVCPLPTGACCKADCTSCVVEERASCEGRGDFYAGDDTTCAACLSPTGACCVGGTQCETGPIVTEEYCINNLVGEWQGCWTTECMNCPPAAPTGACCYSPDGCAEGVVEADCDNQGEVWREGQTCEACEGPCCYVNNDEYNCTHSDKAMCLSWGGVWQGPATSSVDCVNCQFGACCRNSGADCDLGMNQADCATLGGTWLGPGSTECNSDCSPIGACCFPNTGECRSYMPAALCSAQGGVPQGIGTTQCVNCRPPKGPAAFLMSQSPITIAFPIRLRSSASVRTACGRDRIRRRAGIAPSKGPAVTLMTPALTA